MHVKLKGVLAVAVLLAAAVPAAAHITFENREVKAGSTVRFVLRVPHGCGGSATTAVRVAIPDGLADVKPQPKPGWELDLGLELRHAAASGHGHGHGHGEAGTVTEISWSGGNLPDAHYDEFVFRASVSRDAPETLYIPIVQECEVGVDRWIQIPGQGGAAGSLSHPAPSVRVTP